ncbi:CDP-glycerol glycerophosphotransferase family protein [Microbacterium horticulturae]|uniref:CDP-glycerol glycerophosphotransferase family protein n=1 Tax=Microbacterium horticulturae TaxID=3028316 RepID=A0ABY8BYH1_9MICO|nr:CDP-glycerol glycerophosphotransferase family protein [Microbacterium sp. KACC 23027]WEG07891.1 CDP-glycerol glycerophosphotransferase family protein [Microbacterium sp. KACC 23027]
MQRLRSILRRSIFLQRARFWPLAAIYAVLTRFTRVRTNRTLFLSDSREGFSGNFAFLRDEVLRQAPRAEVIGAFKPRMRARRPLKDLLRLPWLLATAQTIVLDDFYPVIYGCRIRPESRLLQVWHAAGAFKRVGYSREKLPGGPPPGSIIHRNYTDATVSSEAIRHDYAEAFGITLSRVKALGVPRTDAFFDEGLVTRTAREVRDRYGIPDAKRIALYAPTFRGNGQITATFDYDSIDWGALTRDLGDDWVVMVKMHPFVKSLAVARPDVRNVIDVTTDREITQLLMAADVLVTDYSSTIFEYALLRRPIVFFCPDLESYTAERDFYYPFERYLSAGLLVRDAAQLAPAISAAKFEASEESFHEYFMSACDGHASERVTREIILNPRHSGTPADAAPGGNSPAPTRASGHMRYRLLVAHLARVLLNVAYLPLRMLPRSRKVLMISREHSSVPEDFVDLEAAIRRADATVRVVILVRMVPPGILAKAGYAFHMLAQLYHVATSRVLVVDTYAMVASLLRHGSGLTIVQIWHALGAFKKFGLSILDHAEGRDARLAKAMRMHEGYDFVLASAEDARTPFAEALGVPRGKVVVAPLPRVDRMLDPVRARTIREHIYASHPHLRGKTVAVFAPTFRLDGQVTVDVADLARALDEIGVHLVVKLHPLMPIDFGTGIDMAPGFSTQEMLQVADMFITDYSSALYEASLLGVPGYFLAPDLEEYMASRDFYLDYRNDLPGPIVEDVLSLAAAIAAGQATKEATRAFAQHWVQIPEESSSAHTPCADTIATLVLRHIGR